MNDNKRINTSNTFGRRLKELRKSKGLTQQVLAELAGIDEKHLCRIENGKYFRSYTTLNNLLVALNVSIEEVGLNLNQIEINENPLIVKALQILNSAKDDNELACYISALKVIQKSLSLKK